MSVDAHVHCGECFHEIATTIKCAGGKTKYVEVALGTQFAVAPGPQGPSLIPRPVPVCPACHERIVKQEQAAASKLIVPQVGAPKLRTGQ